MKAAQTAGMPLWAIKEGAIFPINDISTVSLGPSGGHAATTWVTTYLNAAGASGATTITVKSITDILASDNIGVELDSGNMHWTTVSGAPSGTTVTLAAGLASAAALNSRVYTYTTKTVRPLKVVQAESFDYTTSTSMPVNIVSRDEYMRISDKTVESDRVNQVYYDPQLTRGILNFYPRFLNGNSIIRIWFQRPFEDMDAAGDTLDFPQEWENFIVWELAATIGPEQGVPDRKQTILMQKAIYERGLVEGFGMEEGSVYLTPRSR